MKKATNKKKSEENTYQVRVLALGATGVQTHRRVLESPRPDDGVTLVDVTGAPVLEVVVRLFRVVRSAGRLVHICAHENE